MRIAMSAGHGKYIRGASGYIDEFDENCRVVKETANQFASIGIECVTFIDEVSRSQNENLNRIVDWHNAQTRDFDVSIHFNCNVTTSKPVGTEVLYVSNTGLTLADEVVDDIADASGLINRGPKKRTDLFFLNNTNKPAILVEVCFVDSSADVSIYETKFRDICGAIAEGVSGETVEPGPEPIPPVPPQTDFPTLRKGDTGVWVDYLQQLTPLVNDGIFGSGTESAVKNFQQNQGLTPDGVVGSLTWEALLEYQKPEPPPPPAPAPGELPAEMQRAIKDIAASSDIAGYSWKDRGHAPDGYTQGMALAFATSYRRLVLNDPIGIEMAKANTGNADKDALSWYAGIFNQMGMNNDDPGADTLRHLYVLLLGLGMRESSGKHCEGRDMSASNTTSDTCEAGLFQTSYNAHSCSPQFDALFDQAVAGQSPCYLDTFKQGVSCSSSSWDCYGSGNGYKFQELCKSCPTFAAETCAITLRNLRQHYGPINNRAAEVRTEADQMFHQVQSYLDEMEAVA